MDIYYGQTFDLKNKLVDICMMLHVVPVEYGRLSLVFHLLIFPFSMLMILPSDGTI